MTIERNDPRLTTYVLNELDLAERAEIEAALQESEELRNEVEVHGNIMFQSSRVPKFTGFEGPSSWLGWFTRLLSRALLTICRHPSISAPPCGSAHDQ